MQHQTYQAMKLVIMTKSTFFVEEDKILTALFEEGMDCLHLHKAVSSPLYTERLLSLLPDKFHKKIIVHEHFYLKNEFQLSGIHLQHLQDPIPNGYKGRITRSCSDIKLLKTTKRNADDVFLENIFDSIENPTHKANFNMLQIEEAAKKGLIDKHVYAAGGMHLDNIKLAKDYGFGGVLIRGDLWSRFNIHNETDFKTIISHFQKLRKVIG